MDRGYLQKVLGFHHLNWRDLTYQKTGLASQWDLNSLFMLSYLNQCETSCAPRPLIDCKDDLFSMVRVWRKTSFSSDFFQTLESQENDFAASLQASSPQDATVALDLCCTLSYFWALEYLLKSFLPVLVHPIPVFPREKTLEKWVETELDRVKATQVRLSATLFRASIFPGELEQYSRKNGGVLPSDISVVVEFTRPYVAQRALIDECEDLSFDQGCGIIAMILISRHLAKVMKFNWYLHNVFLDYEFMGEDKHRDFRNRTQPYIILVGCTWNVICKNQRYQSTSPFRAILQWFALLENNIFWMNMDEWDLSETIFCKWANEVFS